MDSRLSLFHSDLFLRRNIGTKDQLDDLRKQILETRGLWEIKGQFMAGPFLNYKFESNTKQDEYIMLDGFVYSPGSSKREYVFELEAIMRSLKN